MSSAWVTWCAKRRPRTSSSLTTIWCPGANQAPGRISSRDREVERLTGLVARLGARLDVGQGVGHGVLRAHRWSRRRRSSSWWGPRWWSWSGGTVVVGAGRGRRGRGRGGGGRVGDRRGGCPAARWWPWSAGCRGRGVRGEQRGGVDGRGREQRAVRAVGSGHPHADGRRRGGGAGRDVAVLRAAEHLGADADRRDRAGGHAEDDELAPAPTAPARAHGGDGPELVVVLVDILERVLLVVERLGPPRGPRRGRSQLGRLEGALHRTEHAGVVERVDGDRQGLAGEDDVVGPEGERRVELELVLEGLVLAPRGRASGAVPRTVGRERGCHRRPGCDASEPGLPQSDGLSRSVDGSTVRCGRLVR